MTTLIPKNDFMNGGTTPVGAVNRTIAQKLQDTISVKDFGAVGDGVADDSTAINNAITYANSIGGGVVFFPPTADYYKCANTLTLLADVTLLGYNYTPLVFTNLTASGDISITGSNTAINGLGITPAATTTSGNSQCVYLGVGSISNIIVENCKFSAALTAGTIFQANTTNIANIVINNNIFIQGNYAVLLNQYLTGTNANITNNTFLNNKCVEINTLAGFTFVEVSGNYMTNASGEYDAFAIGIAHGNTVSVINNIIDGSVQECIHIEDTSTKVLVQGNNIQTTGPYGLSIIQAGDSTSSTNHIIDSNIFQFVGVPTDEIGINFVYDPNVSVHDITVTNNRITNFHTGISLGSALEPESAGFVSGNVIYYCSVGIGAVFATSAIRDNIMTHVTTGVTTQYGGTVGPIRFTTLPTTVGTKTYNNLTFQGLSFISTMTVTGGTSGSATICPVPSVYFGDSMATFGGNTNYATISETGSYNGSAWSAVNSVNTAAGVASAPALAVSGGNIVAQVSSASTVAYRVNVALNGFYTI